MIAQKAKVHRCVLPAPERVGEPWYCPKCGDLWITVQRTPSAARINGLFWQRDKP